MPAAAAAIRLTVRAHSRLVDERLIAPGGSIWFGRDPVCDLVLSDISVSRFHAFLKRGPNGGFQLQDAGSSNGTLVNGASVCRKEAGPPTNVKSGDNIRFGQVDVTFLEADAMRSYLAKFGD